MEIIHIQFETLPSTNQYAKENVSTFSKDALTVISSYEQTAGRGQYGRFWYSPPGNICVTFCFFSPNDQDPFLWTRLMAEVIQKLLLQWKIDATIKWPNDLLVNGKKIVGILTESVPCENQVCVLIGVGFNVNLSKESAQQINQPATSLLLETHQNFDPGSVLHSLTKAFYDRAFM